MGHVLRQLNSYPIINKHEITLQQVQKNLWLVWRKG